MIIHMIYDDAHKQHNEEKVEKEEEEEEEEEERVGRGAGMFMTMISF